MADKNTETTTGTSGSANPMVDATASRLLTGLQGQMDKGTAVFGKSLDAGMGAPTQTGLQTSWTAATQPAFGNYMSGAIDSFGKAAAGEQYGDNDAYYKDLSDQTMTDVSGLFTGSGRFGSGSHVGRAVSELGKVNNANIAADRAWQTQAASMMPGLHAASMLPGQAQVGVGQMYDAGRQAALLGENDLFRRQNDAGKDNLGWASSVLAGTAGAGTQQQSTTSPETPWWQQVLGAGAIGSGIYKNIWGS